MLAVAKFTRLSERKNIAECSLYSMITHPQTHRAQAWRINEPATIHETNEFGCRRGVATALVAFAHRPSCLAVVARQSINKGRFAYSAGAQ